MLPGHSRGPTKKTTRPRQAAELFLEDEAAEDMLSHKFDDLLVLKATASFPSFFPLGMSTTIYVSLFVWCWSPLCTVGKRRRHFSEQKQVS